VPTGQFNHPARGQLLCEAAAKRCLQERLSSKRARHGGAFGVPGESRRGRLGGVVLEVKPA
jgi:hypothetical protein